MAREYISVNSSTKETTQKVKMTNNDNEFHGKLVTTNPVSNLGEDVRDIFIQGIKVNGTQVNPETDENGRKIVNINVRSGSRVYYAVDSSGNDTVDQIVSNGITLNGQPITETSEDKPNAGDFLMIERWLNGSSSNKEHETYVLVNTNGRPEGIKWLQVSPPPIKSIALRGYGSSESSDGSNVYVEIPATIDQNKKATIQLDGFRFNELDAENLEIGGQSIWNFIPNVKAMKNITPFSSQEINDGITLNQAWLKINEIINTLNAIGNTQTGTFSGNGQQNG